MESTRHVYGSPVCSQIKVFRLFLLAALFLSVKFSSEAGDLQLVSAPVPGTASPADGNGYSDAPVISADGRYVLFASSSINLVTNLYAHPFSGTTIRPQQAFVRDRVAGTTTLVSANLSGLPGNDNSIPDAISTNGQYVLFESYASDLVSNDTNNQPNIFLRDLVNQVTILVSVNSNGITGNGISQNAVMTPDGRYIAFSSSSSDLVPNDTNGIPDVFVRDRVAGTTTLVSMGAQSTGSASFPSASDFPKITPDGRYVAYSSLATNLVPGQVAAGQVFVRDLVGGQTIWASTNTQSLFKSIFGSTNAISSNPLISADGNYVFFETWTNSATSRATPPLYPLGLVLRYHLQTGAADLVSTNAAISLIEGDVLENLDITPDGRFVAFVAATNYGNGWASCINLWDGQSGTVSLVSQKLSGTFVTNDDCAWPRLDSSGRYVAFISSVTNLTTNAVSGYNCYLRDTQAGVTTLENVDTNGNGAPLVSASPATLSSDGSLVAFVSSDGDILPNPNPNWDVTDIFVRNNNVNTTELESPHGPSLADTSADFASGISTYCLSSNGLFVAFGSEGPLVAADTNNLSDVYLRDVANQTNILVSVNTNGVAGTGVSGAPSVDASGRYVAFFSYATDLAPGANAGQGDIYLRDMVAGTTQLISLNDTNSGDGNGRSESPTLSADGRYVLFYSWASNLSAGSFSGENLFLRDLQLVTNYALTYSGAAASTMTLDGNRVVFLDTTAGKLCVWDTAAAQRIYTTNYSSFIPWNDAITPALSPDGNSVVYYNNGQLNVASLVSNTVTVLGSGVAQSRMSAHFTSDGRFMTYSFIVTNALNPNAITDIYLYDFQTGSNTLINQAYNSSAAAGPADSPVISPDGRFIAFRSLASNNVPNDFNMVPDLMLYDRSNAITFLITPSVAGNHTAANRSEHPIFSGDGKTLVFASSASDLVPQDFNPGSDVFLLSLAGAYSSGNGNNGTGTNSISGLQMTQTPAGNTPAAITWTTQPGAFYNIQYKNDLNDPVWHELNGSVSVEGTIGNAYDLNASPSNRFYRVTSGN
jgi:Tol biopolymer transport system component